MALRLPRAEYWKRLWKVPVAAGALITSDTGELLILDYTHKAWWGIPGGMVDHAERPSEACAREIQEELGFTLPIGRLLCIDHRSVRDHAIGDASFQMIFDGGTISSSQLASLRLDPHEHVAWRLAPLELAVQLVDGPLAKRLPHCLWAREHDTTVYLEDGEKHGEKPLA
jgi:8-oxo-dGTP diphosphatase